MGLSAKYTSSRRVSLRSDWYADAYWLVDAYVSFSGEALSDRLRSTEFSIVANNLLDKAYLSAITENAAWLGAPQTVSMTATAPVPKPLPTASTSPRRETRAEPIRVCRKRPFATHARERPPARPVVCRIPCLILCLADVNHVCQCRASNAHLRSERPDGLGGRCTVQ